MAGRKLARNVTVGERTYAEGETPEKDVADQISNPKAWQTDEELAAEAEKASASRSSSK